MQNIKVVHRNETQLTFLCLPHIPVSAKGAISSVLHILLFFLLFLLIFLLQSFIKKKKFKAHENIQTSIL